jgi:hypothetical protein
VLLLRRGHLARVLFLLLFLVPAGVAVGQVYNGLDYRRSRPTMPIQTLTIGKRRFVVMPEREFRRLQKRAGQTAVRPEFAQEAMRELKAYRKTGKAADWADVKRKMGL